MKRKRRREEEKGRGRKGRSQEISMIFGKEVYFLYGFKYGICLKCMDTCLGCMDFCRNLTLTPFFHEFWV